MAANPDGQHPGMWVTHAFVPVLRDALDHRGGIPHAVRTAVLAQLDPGAANHRSAALLRERVERRWFKRFAQLPRPEIIERADEIALALVDAPTCSDPRCEDGWHLDTDSGCPRCRHRHVNTNALAPTGPAASSQHVAAAAASIRRVIVDSRTSAHNRQSRHDQRMQRDVTTG